MAEDSVNDIIVRRLNEARTVSYVLTLSVALLTTVLYIEEQHHSRRQERLSEKHEKLTLVRDAADNAVRYLRGLLMDAGRDTFTDRENAREILAAAHSVRRSAARIIDTVVATRLEVARKQQLIRTLSDLERSLGEQFDETPNAGRRFAVPSGERFEEYGLRELALLSFAAGLAPISAAQELEAVRLTPTAGAATLGDLEKTIEGIRNWRVDFVDLRLWAGQLQSLTFEYGSTYGRFAAGGWFSTLSRARKELRTTEHQRLDAAIKYKETKIGLPFLSQQLSAIVVATCFPFLVLGGFVLIAVPLAYARELGSSQTPTRRRPHFDVGIFFSELRKQKRPGRYFAWSVLLVQLSLPVLSSFYVIGLGEHGVGLGTLLFGVAFISLMVALFILRSALEVSRYAIGR